ncbi:hypothetical protein K438DRAFT_648782 [Mycena galopus ATCC 62051]|nr:hypothetical protein K438DRAFT_648782 [Mycena galopus ATCC 62051]
MMSLQSIYLMELYSSFRVSIRSTSSAPTFPLTDREGCSAAFCYPSCGTLACISSVALWRAAISNPFSLSSPSAHAWKVRSSISIFDKQSLMDLLRTLPPIIQRFELKCTSYDDGVGTSIIDADVLGVLTPATDRPFSCPLLRELQLNSCYALSDQALLLFIIARMAVKPPTLRRVQVNFTREIQSDIRPDIQPFLDAGSRTRRDVFLIRLQRRCLLRIWRIITRPLPHKICQEQEPVNVFSSRGRGLQPRFWFPMASTVRIGHRSA